MNIARDQLSNQTRRSQRQISQFLDLYSREYQKILDLLETGQDEQAHQYAQQLIAEIKQGKTLDWETVDGYLYKNFPESYLFR